MATQWPSGLADLALLQAIIDQMPVGVALARMGSGELLLHNAEAVRLIGHPMLKAETYRDYRRYGALRADGSPLPPEEYPIARAALNGEIVEPEEMRYLCGDGRETTLLVGAAPVRMADGQSDLCVATFQDIGRRKVLEEALRAAHAHARNQAAGLMGLLQNMNEGIYILDGNGVLLHVNQAASTLFGIPLSEAAGRTVTAFLEGLDMCDVQGGGRIDRRDWPSQRALAGERFDNLELAVCHRDGTRLFIGSFNGTPITDGDGGLVMAVVSVRDVTERHRADRQRDLLVAELAHRVKNTLATVQTVTRRSLADPAVPAAVRDRLEDRIVALAHAHTLLAETRWAGASLAQVTALQLGPYGDTIEMHGPPVMLGPRATVSIGMALHELATNAAKHGALSLPTGRVALRWRCEAAATPMLRLEWEERGGPPVRPPDRRGFGLTLIERSVPYDLEGTVRLEFHPQGLYCEMVVPSHDPAHDPD